METINGTPFGCCVAAALQWHLAFHEKCARVRAYVTVGGSKTGTPTGDRWKSMEMNETTMSVVSVLLFFYIAALHLHLRGFLFQILPMCRFCPAVICQGRGRGSIFNVWATATPSKSHMLHNTIYYSYEAHKSSCMETSTYICRN